MKRCSPSSVLREINKHNQNETLSYSSDWQKLTHTLSVSWYHGNSSSTGRTVDGVSYVGKRSDNNQTKNVRIL